jgi:hypothetical protein
MRNDVTRAVGWLTDHPWCDHVDAAFAVAVDPYLRPETADVGGKRWPEFLEAVKEACTKPAVSS